MLFWILVVVGIIAAPVGASLGYFAEKSSDHPHSCPSCGFFAGGAVGVVIMFFLFIAPVVVWNDHASDVSKVVAQEHRIEVQQERIESLTKRLDTFSFPRKASVSLDNDHPWSSIVESLTDAENKLAAAKDERAVAIRSIEARKIGPMSGVVTLVGDPSD